MKRDFCDKNKKETSRVKQCQDENPKVLSFSRKEGEKEREREKVTPMLNIETCTARGVLAQRDPE